MRLTRLHTMEKLDKGFDSCFRVALIGEPGRIYTKVVYIDSPIRLHKVPNGDIERYAKDIEGSAKSAARKMLKAGKRLGITKSAKKFLRRNI